MQFFSGLVLCLFVGLVACDEFDCYRNAVVECEKRERTEKVPKLPTPDEEFCRGYAISLRCQRDAAVECKTGFEDVARKALFVFNDACTKGTTSYNDIRSDSRCPFNTLYEAGDCSGDLYKEIKEHQKDFLGDDRDNVIAHLRILCRHLPGIKSCVSRKFTGCTSTSREAFLKVIEPSFDLQTKVCAIVPSQ